MVGFPRVIVASKFFKNYLTSFKYEDILLTQGVNKIGTTGDWMNIIFRNTKLRKQCNSLKNAQRKWGTRRGKLLLDRLNEIADSDNLGILEKLPRARCHQLKGDLARKWSLDLEHPYRLIIEPADDPIPETEDGSVDVSKITSVKILGVEDTHGR